jgi:hypothetical protein
MLLGREAGAGESPPTKAGQFISHCIFETTSRRWLAMTLTMVTSNGDLNKYASKLGVFFAVEGSTNSIVPMCKQDRSLDASVSIRRRVDATSYER